MNIICYNYTCPILYRIISKSIELASNSINYLTDKSTVYNNIKIIAELDIMFNLELIKDVCKNIDTDNTSIKLAIYKINETLDLLNRELSYIYEQIKDHENKYLHNWRSLDLSSNVELVEKLNIVLINRYRCLIDLLKIYNRI